MLPLFSLSLSFFFHLPLQNILYDIKYFFYSHNYIHIISSIHDKLDRAKNQLNIQISKNFTGGAKCFVNSKAGANT